jgi:hypothetical protein
MSTSPVHRERRAAQRFDFHLPVSICLPGSDRRGSGFTQDLSARGALICTDFPLSEGDAVELTLVMPSEITLADNMRIRCRGTVLRPAQSAKSGVAVHLEGYEFLPAAEAVMDASGAFDRISALHEHPQEKDAEMTPHTFHARSATLA